MLKMIKTKVQKARTIAGCCCIRSKPNFSGYKTAQAMRDRDSCPLGRGRRATLFHTSALAMNNRLEFYTAVEVLKYEHPLLDLVGPAPPGIPPHAESLSRVRFRLNPLLMNTKQSHRKIQAHRVVI